MASFKWPPWSRWSIKPVYWDSKGPMFLSYRQRIYYQILFMSQLICSQSTVCQGSYCVSKGPRCLWSRDPISFMATWILIPKPLPLLMSWSFLCSYNTLHFSDQAVHYILECHYGIFIFSQESICEVMQLMSGEETRCADSSPIYPNAVQRGQGKGLGNLSSLTSTLEPTLVLGFNFH